MTTQSVHRASYPNNVWGCDFVFYQTDDVRRLNCMIVVDEFTRQGPVADAVQSWLREKHVDTHYIVPGSPRQDTFSKSINNRSDHLPGSPGVQLTDWYARGYQSVAGAIQHHSDTWLAR